MIFYIIRNFHFLALHLVVRAYFIFLKLKKKKRKNFISFPFCRVLRKGTGSIYKKSKRATIAALHCGSHELIKILTPRSSILFLFFFWVVLFLLVAPTAPQILIPLVFGVSPPRNKLSPREPGLWIFRVNTILHFFFIFSFGFPDPPPASFNS